MSFGKDEITDNGNEINQVGKEDIKLSSEEKKQKKLAAEALARKRAEEEVYADVWTQDQQIAFENALLDNGPEKAASIERGQRWTIISAAVSSVGQGAKSRNQCLARYAYLKRYVRENKKN